MTVGKCVYQQKVHEQLSLRHHDNGTKTIRQATKFHRCVCINKLISHFYTCYINDVHEQNIKYRSLLYLDRCDLQGSWRGFNELAHPPGGKVLLPE